MRGNGGRIGPKHTPTTGSASGVWGLAEAGDYRRQSLWPPLVAELYTFTSATFTPGGQTGRNGPSLAQARTGLTGTGVDAWKSNTAFFNTSSGIQLWTVPATGTYSLNCYGAQGADGLQDGQGTPASSGGLGARIQGNFQLTEGQVLSIVVGQRGITQTNSWGGGGGGGGTFVWVTGQTTNPLVAAGGGGCGGIGNQAQSGGQTGTSGSAGQNNGGAGGTGGNTSPSQGICGGGGGQGWLGGQSYMCGGNFTWPTLFTNPTGYSSGGHDPGGGFGGGGGSYGGGGGGGGYSGGGSGGWSYAGRGGGGGSYNAGSSPIATGATWSGQGQVIITRL